MIILEGQKMVSLIDSGSDYNLLREDAYQKIEGAMLKNLKENLSGVGGKITTLGITELLTEIDGVDYDLTYRVVPKGSIPEEVLLGEDLQNLATIQLGQRQPTIFPREAYLLQVQGEQRCQLPSMDHLDNTQIEEVEKLVSSYQPTEMKEAPVTMKIILKDDTPISRPPYRLAPKEKKEVDEQVEEWLQKGIVRPSTSDFASNVVVARKKDGRARVCINYKPLNTVVVRERQPLLLIEDVID